MVVPRKQTNSFSKRWPIWSSKKSSVRTQSNYCLPTLILLKQIFAWVDLDLSAQKNSWLPPTGIYWSSIPMKMKRVEVGYKTTNSSQRMISDDSAQVFIKHLDVSSSPKIDLKHRSKRLKNYHKASILSVWSTVPRAFIYVVRIIIRVNFLRRKEKMKNRRHSIRKFARSGRNLLLKRISNQLQTTNTVQSTPFTTKKPESISKTF